jgi:hypothetical protein
MNQIWLYDLFRKELRLPDDKAAAFVKAIEDVAESEGARKNHLLATKEDIHELKSDMQVLKSDMQVLKGDMQILRGDLELKIEQSKNDVYKAMFISGIVQLIAILSGTLAIVKFAK